MKSIPIISASFGAFMKNPLGFLLYVILYSVCSVVAFGAAAGATLIVAMTGIVEPAVAGQITFLLATAVIFLAIWLLFILMFSGIQAAFFRSLYEAGRGSGMGLIQFLEYAAHKALPVFGVELALLAILAIFMAPAALALFFVKNTLVAGTLALVGGLAFIIVSLFFTFAIPAIVLDNESSIGSIVRSAKIILSAPVDFVVLVVVLFVISAAFGITIIGPWIVMPQILAYSSMLFYSQMKKG